jgi:hypothetical protein
MRHGDWGHGILAAGLFPRGRCSILAMASSLDVIPFNRSLAATILCEAAVG